jgi:hypothetical protein
MPGEVSHVKSNEGRLLLVRPWVREVRTEIAQLQDRRLTESYLASTAGLVL